MSAVPTFGVDELNRITTCLPCFATPSTTVQLFGANCSSLTNTCDARSWLSMIRSGNREASCADAGLVEHISAAMAITATANLRSLIVILLPLGVCYLTGALPNMSSRVEASLIRICTVVSG